MSVGAGHVNVRVHGRLLVSTNMGKTATRAPGEKLGNWILQELIGGGGNGHVWRVSPANGVGEECALKLLKRTSETIFKRFVAEIGALKQAKNVEGIVPLLDEDLHHRPEAGPRWYVMPLAEPAELGYARRNAVAVVDAFVPLARTLAELHALDIHHRDIKPPNLLFLGGRLCFSDFGLVKYLDGRDRADLSRHAVSPERIMLMTDPVPLDRQFVRWDGEGTIDADLAQYLEGLGSNFDWEGLLERWRVVILAEAGSGKSTELRDQARRMGEEGRTTFITTLQKIGQRGGLQSALGTSEWRRFEQWRSTTEPCWLFLDSVDEAKRADFTLFDILTDVADAIDGFSTRIHIVLSGRVSDWEFKRDLKTLLERIPLPPPDEKLEPVSPDQELIAALRNQKRNAPEPAEKPLVVVMAALDRARIETFARAQGITDVDRLCAELDRQNLWSFARRPTDLDWLAGYWRTEGKFGSLQQMLDVSITERLKETNQARARRDALDAAKARALVERIGAALVLQQLDTVVVPDTDGEARRDVAFLDLKDIAPDLTPGEQNALINRPIFDPATPGFVRLHNDNQAAVRGFLAAKWLVRLRKEGNLPVSRIFELLFAEPYGVGLVIPSRRSTAAWLALWDAEAAQEIIKRDPRLLMDGGDPSSLNLDLRVRALDDILKTAAEDEHFSIPDHDALRRFAQSDLADYVRDRWATHKASPGARTLLLLLIHLGKLGTCADIAIEAVRGGYSDHYASIFGGRALLSTGSTEQLQTYIAYLIDYADKLHPSLVWDALDELFPTLIVAADLLTLIKLVRSKGSDGGLGLDYYGPRLAARVTDAVSARQIVDGLTDRLEVKVDIFRETSPLTDEQLLETLEVAAARYASLIPASVLPTSIVDAAIRVGESLRRGRRHRRSRDKDALDLEAEINVSPERRRVALWRCAEQFRMDKKTPLNDPWQLQFIGLAPRIQAADLDWLIEDIASRTNEDDLRLATNGAMRIWRDGGDDPTVLWLIRAASDAKVVQQTIDSWLASSKRDPQHERFEAEQAKRKAQNAIDQARSDQSWINLRNDLQANPGLLLDYLKPGDGKVDARLYHLWRLLSRLGDNCSHYAIADLSPLRPLFGDAVVDSFRKAMIQYWRLLHTALPSEVSPEERRTSGVYDLLGIFGVTLEAGSNPNWAMRLNEDEAKLATRFATRELNGFPKWIDDLAAAHAEVVKDVLWLYLAVDLEPTNTLDYRMHLNDVASAGDAVATLMAPLMLDWLDTHPDVPDGTLDKALRLIAREPDSLAAAVPLASRRSLEPHGRWTCAAYIGLVYAHDAAVATDLLIQAFQTMTPKDQALLAQAALPRAFGTRYGLDKLKMSPVPFTSLERLVLLAFEQIRPDEDNNRPSLEVYSPDERDYAEDARSGLFNTLVNTPGFATYAAIQRFRQIPDFPVRDRRLRELAFERAAVDSEPAALRASDVLTFEKEHDLVPATSTDLQRVGVARLGDIEHRLLHGDFNQGLTVARLPNEVDVQNWFAEALAAIQGHSYALEREPHVAEEKEPDIRLSSLRDPSAKSPIEIKVAGSWSLRQLEEALTIQLRDRYLRDKDNRFGILLVVHNSTRVAGWQQGTGYLQFAEVMAHLKEIARGMAAADALAPQMIPVGIDLSHFAQRIKAAEAEKARAAPKLATKSKH